MRVLHVYSGNLFGGVESILLTLAARGPMPLTHAFALAFDGRLSRQLGAAGAEVHRIGPARLARPQTVFRARRTLAHLLARSRDAFDRVICHAPWAHGLFGGVVRRSGVPLVFWAHDAMTGRHWTEMLARRVAPSLAICNSAFTASTLPALYPNVPSRVVHAPVSAAPRPLSSDERGRLRGSLNTTGSDVVIIQASRSEAWKGHTVLVDALARLRDLPGWTWWHVGAAQRPSEAAYLLSLQRRTQSAGIADRVRWLGEREDVARLLGAADLYCQPNLAPEPFGVVFVEALAAGLPVVTSAIGGAPEIVDDTCGVLVPPNDPGELARAIGGLLAEPEARRRRALAGPARARQISDPEAQVGRLAAALDSIPSRGR